MTYKGFMMTCSLKYSDKLGILPEFHIQPYEFISKNDLTFSGQCCKVRLSLSEERWCTGSTKIIHYCQLEIKNLKTLKNDST